ncbi:MAG TPA: DUF1700 domain-containing protein [Oscillospiraceae bacterium]|nr:DUF1700 domain-containing protein [Oscillospiraceae bacterium]HPF55109.1 DUF1700 domain-containing protein [Clostridiales bacterium]HPK34573.1 DUF1700 domain-containing protein [Oscillospiraceae bacterium]HPR76744.1 DUF1700 domain-containing protein [Oscillospiraceae bacterium]
MTKREFLDDLKSRLSQLPPDEIGKRLAYYAELIDDMTEDGMDEAAAVDKLGDISKIAEDILREQPLQTLVKSRVRPRGGWTALNIILLVLGFPVWFPILMAIFAVVLSIYVVIWSVVVVLFAVVFAIAASGLALIVGGIWNMFHNPLLALMVLGSGVALAGLSILAFLGAMYTAKGLAKLTVLIARGIKTLFIRKKA